MDERDMTCGELLYKSKIETVITLISRLSHCEKSIEITSKISLNLI